MSLTTEQKEELSEFAKDMDDAKKIFGWIPTWTPVIVVCSLVVGSYMLSNYRIEVTEEKVNRNEQAINILKETKIERSDLKPFERERDLKLENIETKIVNIDSKVEDVKKTNSEILKKLNSSSVYQ